jgi:hypothetical protein
MHFEKHVFICTNDKDAPKKCCGSSHGMELIDAFRPPMRKQEIPGRFEFNEQAAWTFVAKDPRWSSIQKVYSMAMFSWKTFKN